MNARRELPGEFDHLRSLISDNPSQMERAHDLRSSVERRLLILQRAVEMRKHGGPDISEALLISGPGKVEMDHVREVSDAMEAEEDRLLAIRTVSTHAASGGRKVAVIVVSALDFLLILFAFWQFTRERELRFAAEIASGPEFCSRSKKPRPGPRRSDNSTKRSKIASAFAPRSWNVSTASSKHSATQSHMICALRCARLTVSVWRCRRTMQQTSTMRTRLHRPRARWRAAHGSAHRCTASAFPNYTRGDRSRGFQHERVGKVRRL